MSKEIFVGFADSKIKEAYLSLKEGKGAEPHLYEFLSRAFDDLKKDPFCGIKIIPIFIIERFVVQRHKNPEKSLAQGIYQKI